MKSMESPGAQSRLLKHAVMCMRITHDPWMHAGLAVVQNAGVDNPSTRHAFDNQETKAAQLDIAIKSAS
jgi:hypothetical protein